MRATDSQEDLEASEPHAERDVSEAPLIGFGKRVACLKNMRDGNV